MKKNGFTLIEILVTITIIAVLLAVAMVSYTSINKRSRDARRRSDVEQLRSALEMYRADNGNYPNTGAEYLRATDTSLSTLLTTYLSPMPVDPIQSSGSDGNSYWYKPISCATNCYGYCILSYLEQETSAVANSNCTSGTALPTGRFDSYAANP